MFGQTATSSSGGFGSSSGGGLFGNTQNTSTGGGLFGGGTTTGFGQASTPTTSPFQSTNTNTGGSSLFGGSTSTNTAGTGLFGGGGTQQSSGGLFGGTTTGSSGGGLFGNTGSTTSATGLFGSSNTGGGGLFGSSSSTNTGSGTGLFGSTPGSSTGGGLFGSSNTTNTASAFGSVSNSAFGSGAQQQATGAQRFSGAIPLLTYAEATDLRFGNIPNGLGADQNACVTNGIIPEPLRTQFMEQEARMSDQEYKLSEVSSESTDEFNQLLRLTAMMDQSVSHLRSLIDQQREAVQFLVFEAKGCGRVAEKALHEARRLNNTSNVHMINKPIPSDFFWKLVQSLEARIEEYQAKSNELHKVLFGDDMPADENTSHANNRRLPAGVKNALATQNILETLRQQHQGFKVVASQVAVTHEKMNALREQYNDWIVLMTGQPPKDFQQEDNAEKERRQRLLRKVEESAQAISVNGAKPANQPGTTSSVFGSTGQQTSSTSGGLFGSSNTTTSGGLLGNTSTQSSGTGLFGSSQSTSTSNTGLFGGNSAGTSTQGSGLFGSSSTNTTDQSSSSLFGGSSLTAAPRKNKTKRSSSSSYR